MVNVKELLQPIFHRLHDIKSQKVSLFDSDYLAKAELNLDAIERCLFSVDKSSIIADLQILLNKVEQLQSNDIDYTKNFNDEWGIGNTAEDINSIVAMELSLYSDKIKGFIKDLNADSKLVGTIFQLPENFKADDLLKAGFTPLLNEKGAAYFLYLLRHCNFLPQYSDLSLSKLTPILLGRGMQNSRENFGKIPRELAQNKADIELKILKEQIENMLHVIDSWLKA